MIITTEHEIEIDETKYVTKIKIRKYYKNPPEITEAILIDFEDENIEIQKTKTGTTSFNHKGYCMDEEIIKKGLVLFDRDNLVKLQNSNCNEKDLDICLLVISHDLNGHRLESIVDPRDTNNPIYNILKWLKTEYEEFVELQEFVKDIVS